jgi:hypothetical protein
MDFLALPARMQKIRSPRNTTSRFRNTWITYQSKLSHHECCVCITYFSCTRRNLWMLLISQDILAWNAMLIYFYDTLTRKEVSIFLWTQGIRCECISRSTPTVDAVSVFHEVLTLGIYVVTKELTQVKQCLCFSQDIPHKNAVYFSCRWYFHKAKGVYMYTSRHTYLLGMRCLYISEKLSVSMVVMNLSRYYH